MIVSIIIAGSIYYFDHRISEDMYDHKDDTVEALGKTIAAQAVGYFINHRSDAEFDDMIISNKQANPELIQIVLIDKTGLIRAHSDDILNIRKQYHPPEQISLTILSEPQQLQSNRDDLKYLIIPITLGQTIFGHVHITYSTEMIYQQLTQARKQIFALTVIAVLFGVVGIYLLSNYFVSPILKITHRIRRYTSGDLETELPLEGAEEFFEISKAFNQMITRLSQDRKNISEREKMAKEIEVASEIQKTLLPHKLPEIENIEIETFYRAASIVGGDLYDVFKISEEKYCLVVADVSGKGVPASLVMSMLRTVIQIYAAPEISPKDILVHVNDYLKVNIPPGMFVTVFMVIYDSVQQKISYVSAGHNPMLYFDSAKDEIQQLNPKGMPLGLPTRDKDKFANILIEESKKLNDGDCFFIFTDGVTEAADREGKQFGIEQLTTLLYDSIHTVPTLPITELSDIVMNALDDFTGFVKAADDISYIVARFIKKAEKKQNKEPDDSIAVKKISGSSADS